MDKSENLPEACTYCSRLFNKTCGKCVRGLKPKEVNIKPVENIIPKTYDYQENN